MDYLSNMYRNVVSLTEVGGGGAITNDQNSIPVQSPPASKHLYQSYPFEYHGTKSHEYNESLVGP